MAITFYVMVRTHNTYGGDQTMSLVPSFLLGDEEDFGPALRELTVTFNISTGRKPKKTDKVSGGFPAYYLSLPKVVFKRKREQASIDVAWQLPDGRTVFRGRHPSLALFTSAVVETVKALQLLRKRIKPTDSFNLEGFLGHCEKALLRLPSSEKELDNFTEEAERRYAARYQAMSAWEKLGIDWRDYHPDARALLDDPLYWDSANDFAPHGNDTGADLLADYRKWLRRNSAGEPVGFLHGLLRRWGMPLAPTTDTESSVLDEAAVGLAFAELKLRAACRSEAIELALAALDRQRQQAVAATHREHREERLKSLAMLEAKLSTVSRG